MASSLNKQLSSAANGSVLQRASSAEASYAPYHASGDGLVSAKTRLGVLNSFRVTQVAKEKVLHPRTPHLEEQKSLQDSMVIVPDFPTEEEDDDDFELDLDDRYYTGDDVCLAVTVTSPDSKLDQVESYVTCNKDGSFTVSYQPTVPGNYRIAVTASLPSSTTDADDWVLVQHHIIGSPFNLRVNPAGCCFARRIQAPSAWKENENNMVAWDVAVSLDQKVFICDATHTRVVVFDGRDDPAHPFGKFIRTIGQYGKGQGRIGNPSALAICGSELLVLDSDNSIVQVFDVNNGAFLRQFGESGREPGKLYFPSAMAVAQSSNQISLLFIGDLQNRIQIFSSQGRFLGNLSLPSVIPALLPSGAALNAADFLAAPIHAPLSPGHMAVSMDGTLLAIRDFNNKCVHIFRIADCYHLLALDANRNVEEKQHSKVPDDLYVQCIVDSAAMGGVAFSSDSKTLFAVDSEHDLIRAFRVSDGTVIGEFGGSGTADGLFSNPIGICVSHSGHLFVCDNLNERVQIFM